MKTKDTEALGRQRAKPSRSKPDTVDQPVRTARTFVHRYNTTLLHNTVTQRRFFCNITLPPDQHHVSDVAKWR